ncbi:MAG TPA: hypothetical protein VFN55_02950 [Solirubrobacteraceae bacterium]|nr:hypothetical protein [Solirubrobacteraceae bacterium]
MPSAGELEHLRAEARHARNRARLYKARTYGQWPTSPVRLRELERIADGAEARLRAAEAEARPGDSAADRSRSASE